MCSLYFNFYLKIVRGCSLSITVYPMKLIKLMWQLLLLDKKLEKVREVHQRVKLA